MYIGVNFTAFINHGYCYLLDILVIPVKLYIDSIKYAEQT